jgi:hypothetical protein
MASLAEADAWHKADVENDGISFEDPPGLCQDAAGLPYSAACDPTCERWPCPPEAVLLHLDACGRDGRSIALDIGGDALTKPHGVQYEDIALR